MSVGDDQSMPLLIPRVILVRMRRASYQLQRWGDHRPVRRVRVMGWWWWMIGDCVA